MTRFQIFILVLGAILWASGAVVIAFVLRERRRTTGA
jgi:uncharacterized membrane protein